MKRMAMIIQHYYCSDDGKRKRMMDRVSLVSPSS
jgi:hypothetical protein